MIPYYAALISRRGRSKNFSVSRSASGVLLSSDVNCSELLNGNNTVEWLDSGQI